MPLFKFIFISLFCLISISSYADVEIKTTQHPIDSWLEEKLSEESLSDTRMREITYQAQVKWEAEMNNVYKRLMQKLGHSQQTTLHKAQQQWLKYRNAEGQAIVEIISAQQGTMHQLSGTNRGMQLVRQRTLDLISYESELEN